MSQTISRIRSGSLADAAKLKKYIMVRKGKALLVRALRHLEEENMKVCILSITCAVLRKVIKNFSIKCIAETINIFLFIL